tara:strand:+ start:447 stop:554 length:108 start_codon:yes stop_codon:yes gene_type:complete
MKGISSSLSSGRKTKGMGFRKQFFIETGGWDLVCN